MHTSKSRQRKIFRPYAVASAAIVALTAAGALVAGVTPAAAASLAAQPDTQIAVFMVPLALLVLVMLFEVTRAVVRGNLPAERPVPVRAARRPWSPRQRPD